MAEDIKTAIVAVVLLITKMASAPYMTTHAIATGIVNERMDSFKATRRHLKSKSRLIGSAKFEKITGSFFRCENGA